MDTALKDVESNLAVLGRECGSRAVEVRPRALGKWREGRTRGEKFKISRVAHAFLSLLPSFPLSQKGRGSGKENDER